MFNHNPSANNIDDASPETFNAIQEKVYNLKVEPQIRQIRYFGADPSLVQYETFELSAVCPATRLPDQYHLRIFYIPDKYMPELKSLKMYLTAYRNLEVFHETLANKIANDFYEACHPQQTVVSLKAFNRGGIFAGVVTARDREGTPRALEDEVSLTLLGNSVLSGATTSPAI